jgi:iron complex outermembrane receptor protein
LVIGILTLSNTFGKNSFDYGVENTNSSMRENSPTTFDAGRLAQNHNYNDMNQNLVIWCF